MLKSPEQFDFSKKQDQQKFDRLPVEEKGSVAEEAFDEAALINNMVANDLCGSYTVADRIVEKLKSNKGFSAEVANKAVETAQKIDDELMEVKFNKSEIETSLKRISKKKKELLDASKFFVSDCHEASRAVFLEHLSQIYPELVTIASQIEEDKLIPFSSEDWKQNKQRSDENYTLLREKIISLASNIEERLSLTLALNALDNLDRRAWNPMMASSPAEFVKAVSNMGLKKYFKKEINYKTYNEYDLDTTQYHFDWWDSEIMHKLIKKVGLLNKEDAGKYIGYFEQLVSLKDEEEKLNKRKENLQKKRDVQRSLCTLGFNLGILNEKSWAAGFIDNDESRRIKDLVFDEKEQLVAYIKSVSNHSAAFSGSGGSEYGTKIVVFRDNPSNQVSEYVKWRDAYSASRDNPALDFDKIEIAGITADTVSVHLFTQGSHIHTIEFPLKKSAKKERVVFSEEESEKWLGDYKKIEEETRKSSGIKGFMPVYVDLKYYEGPSLAVGEDTSRMIPYREPMVLNRKVNEKLGIGTFVVMSQIDHDMWKGKEFRYEGWGIDRSGKKTRLFLQNAYEDQLRGSSRVAIDVTAEELFERMQKELEK